MRKLNKRADIDLDTILKLILALIVLLIIIGLIFLLKGKSINILTRIKEVFLVD